MMRIQLGPSLKWLCAMTLILICLTGCHAKGSSQSSSTASRAVGSVQDDGPSAEEVERDLIAGLPQYINQYCATGKLPLLASLKSIRYQPGTWTLVNTVNGSHRIITTSGTLFWDYKSKALHLNPSAGTPLNVSVTNDPSQNVDHLERWEFFAFGPWADALDFTFDKNCQRFS
jgi:hypothetical protein